jgi:hypothetical protein
VLDTDFIIRFPLLTALAGLFWLTLALLGLSRAHF